MMKFKNKKFHGSEKEIHLVYFRIVLDRSTDFQKNLAQSSMTPRGCTIVKQRSENILKAKSLQQILDFISGHFFICL